MLSRPRVALALTAMSLAAALAGCTAPAPEGSGQPSSDPTASAAPAPASTPGVPVDACPDGYAEAQQAEADAADGVQIQIDAAQPDDLALDVLDGLIGRACATRYLDEKNGYGADAVVAAGGDDLVTQVAERLGGDGWTNAFADDTVGQQWTKGESTVFFKAGPPEEFATPEMRELLTESLGADAVFFQLSAG